MAKKIQGEKFEQPVPFSAKNVIVKPDLWDVTKKCSIGLEEYHTLTKWDCGVWLNLIIGASLGICLEKIYKFLAFMWNSYTGNQEGVEQLNWSQAHRIDMSILKWSGAFFVVLLIVNVLRPNPRKKLLKKILLEIKGSRSTIASKPKGNNSD